MQNYKTMKDLGNARLERKVIEVDENTQRRQFVIVKKAVDPVTLDVKEEETPVVATQIRIEAQSIKDEIERLTATLSDFEELTADIAAIEAQEAAEEEAESDET